MTFIDYDKNQMRRLMYLWYIEPSYIIALNNLDGFIGVFSACPKLLYKRGSLIPASVPLQPVHLGFRDEDAAIIAKLSL